MFFGRFVAILRAFAAFLAGVNRLPWPRFLVFNALGGIVWATIFGVGGYFLGLAFEKLRAAGRDSRPVLAVDRRSSSASASSRHHEEALREKAEAALPGPLAAPK